MGKEFNPKELMSTKITVSSKNQKNVISNKNCIILVRIINISRLNMI